MIEDGIPEIAQALRLGHVLHDKVGETYSHVAAGVEARHLRCLQNRWNKSVANVPAPLNRTWCDPASAGTAVCRRGSDTALGRLGEAAHAADAFDNARPAVSKIMRRLVDCRLGAGTRVNGQSSLTLPCEDGAGQCLRAPIRHRRAADLGYRAGAVAAGTPLPRACESRSRF
jgi:hypothetical protein